MYQIDHKKKQITMDINELYDVADCRRHGYYYEDTEEELKLIEESSLIPKYWKNSISHLLETVKGLNKLNRDKSQPHSYERKNNDCLYFKHNDALYGIDYRYTIYEPISYNINYESREKIKDFYNNYYNKKMLIVYDYKDFTFLGENQTRLYTLKFYIKNDLKLKVKFIFIRNDYTQYTDDYFINTILYDSNNYDLLPYVWTKYQARGKKKIKVVNKNGYNLYDTITNINIKYNETIRGSAYLKEFTTKNNINLNDFKVYEVVPE